MASDGVKRVVIPTDASDFSKPALIAGFVYFHVRRDVHRDVGWSKMESGGVPGGRRRKECSDCPLMAISSGDTLYRVRQLNHRNLQRSRSSFAAKHGGFPEKGPPRMSTMPTPKTQGMYALTIHQPRTD